MVGKIQCLSSILGKSVNHFNADNSAVARFINHPRNPEAGKTEVLPDINLAFTFQIEAT